jgi:hypothetical protein
MDKRNATIDRCNADTGQYRKVVASDGKFVPVFP